MRSTLRLTERTVEEVSSVPAAGVPWRLILAAVAAVAVAVVGAACGEKISPGANCPLQNPITFADPNLQIMLKRCTSCHSSKAKNRLNAPLGIDYDTYDSALKNALVGRYTIVNGSMPVGGALNDVDKCIYEAWAQSGFAK